MSALQNQSQKFMVGFANVGPASPVAGFSKRRRTFLLLLGENSPVGFCTTENSRKPHPYTAESPAPEKRFEVVASGNEHETDSVYTTRAAGGDSTKRIKDVAHLRQTARETARDLHESMEREELQRDSNGNQRRIIIHKGIGAVHGHYCNLPTNKRIVVSFHDSVAIGELGSGLESR